MSQTASPVLILEDDPELRQILESLLSDEGYDVSAAASGEEALELSRHRRFDVIVADIRMPGMDGLQAVQHLRGHDPQIQSLVMTGYASEEDPIRALHIGVQGYLRKPFSLDDFLVRVRELVQKNQAAREQQAALQRVTGSLQWTLRQALNAGVKAGIRTMSQLLALVEQLARALALRGRESYPTWLECAALVACLRRYGLGGASLHDEPDWPAPVEEILDALEERWDGQGVPEGLSGEAIPIAARLIALALAAWQAGYTMGDPRAAQLGVGEPGRYDPAMLKVLSEPQRNPAEPSQIQACVRLLSLASILLEKGAYRQLREIYAEVLASDCLLSQRLEALLGMTQVALGEEISDEALMHARHLIKACENAGPLTRASSLLRLGICLCSRGLEAGRDCLTQARRQFQAARHEPGTVEASLALAHFSNELLDLPGEGLAAFLRSVHLVQWIRGNPWALVCLLERCSQEQLIRPVIRMASQNLPHLLQKLRASTLLSDIGLRRLDHVLSASSPAADEAPAIPALQVFSLGGFELFYQGGRLDERHWPTQKVKYLAARLFADFGRPIPEDVLIEEFWAGELDKGRRNLGWSLTQVRRILRDSLGDTVSVVRRGNTVMFSAPQPPWHDLTRLQADLDAGDSAPLAPERLSEMLSLYRGSYLPEHYADWAVALRERLESRLCNNLTKSLQEAQGLSLALRAEVAHKLLDIDPCHQPAVAELMSQAIAQSRPEEAVRLYKRLTARLHSEVGIEPDLRLVELFYRADLGVPSGGG